MNRETRQLVPEDVRNVFVVICLLGLVSGFARGSGHLSDLMFGVVGYVVPLVFVVWAVFRVDPLSLGQLTGYDRWRDEQDRWDDWAEQRPKRARPPK
jgi:hypothetical protein